MPRHRKEHVPLYRVRRHASNSVRRAPIHAAVKPPAAEEAAEASATVRAAVKPPAGEEAAEASATVRAAVKPPAGEEAAEASATVPLPALRRHLLQITSPASPAALGGGNLAARAARRLMGTPWFAVATGFVVAAGLWIYSPHVGLNLPNGAVGRSPCKTHGCGIGSSSPNTNQAGGALLPMTGPVTKMHTSAAPRLKFGYRVIWQSQGRFGLQITVSGADVPHSWRLAFQLPGDDITFVQGASWQPLGGYSGIASWPADGPWQFGGRAGYQGGDHHDGRRSELHGDTILVYGEGAAVQPEDCSFNGKSCEITLLS